MKHELKHQISRPMNPFHSSCPAWFSGRQTSNHQQIHLDRINKQNKHGFVQTATKTKQELTLKYTQKPSSAPEASKTAWVCWGTFGISRPQRGTLKKPITMTIPSSVARHPAAPSEKVQRTPCKQPNHVPQLRCSWG